MTDAVQTIELVSNGYPLSSAPNRLGRLTPTDPHQSRAKLWEQYQAQGYLWLKDILPHKEVLAFRRRYFQTLNKLIAPGTDPTDGIWSGESIPNFNRELVEVVRWAAYESFCLMEPIWQFYEMFLEGPAYLHKRKLIRHGVPTDTHTTGAHYDLTYLRGGTNRVCTSWIPIGDVSVAMGGLVYLEGSDAWGRKMEAEFAAQNQALPPAERISAYNKNTKTGWLGLDLAPLADSLDSRWLVADYELGDMVVHSPYMIHASTMNVDPAQRIRLSTDIRYQRVTDEIDVRWNNHWSLDDML
jgi:ectoine hydroxylase-related dioxygenase (phytanoyl-CoA dioxygenase family)